MSKDEVEARKAALVAFVRGGKGIGGIHATGDSYHSPCANDPGAAARGAGGRGGPARTPGGTLAAVILRWSWGVNDKKLQTNDQTLTKADMEAVADAIYSQLDTGKAGKVTTIEENRRTAARVVVRIGGLQAVKDVAENHLPLKHGDGCCPVASSGLFSAAAAPHG